MRNRSAERLKFSEENMKKQYIEIEKFDWKELVDCTFNPITIFVGILFGIPLISFFMYKWFFNYYGSHPESKDLKHYGIVKKRIYIKIEI